MTNLTDPIFTDDNVARLHLEAIRWPDRVFCPFCGTSDQVKALGGKSMGPGWYHCGTCRDKFTVRTGSVFERSHVPLHKWILAFHLMAASKKGMSAHQLGRMLGVTYKTAWFMAHRIRESMRDENPGPLGGEGKTVEADETHIGKRKLEYKRYTKRGWDHKCKVVALVERGGKSRAVHVDMLDRKTVREVLVTSADRASVLNTDEAGI